MVIFHDEKTGRLISMPKMGAETNAKWHSLRSKRGHPEANVAFGGAEQNEFRVVLRRTAFNALVFSAVPIVQLPRSTRRFRLRRYKGNNDERLKLVEGNCFRAFDIHTATERYQRRITLLRHQKAGPRFRSMVVSENQQSSWRNVLARLADLTDRQYSSLGGNKDRIRRHREDMQAA